ncbi:MAG: M15 family metallopeptidase [Clostridia bacterium]|nr:M15 family metallopeptidase [Clostridia bacterium]
MPSPLRILASITAAGVIFIGTPLAGVSPQHNPDDLLLVNRGWPISGDYVPADLRVTEIPGQVRKLRREASAAMEAMAAALRQETGKRLISVSGYRPYDKQSRIYDRKLKQVGGVEALADEYVARPGTSEHQTGLTMDVGERGVEDNLGNAFGTSVSGQWVRENCWRFGFILRYDRGWETVTGYEYEPWHLRYVGPEHAAYLHEHPMPLEAYLPTVRAERYTLYLRIPDDD